MKLFAAQLDFDPIAREFELPEAFSPQLHEQAASANDRFAEGRTDLRDVEFVTIDPPSSQDLDQAVNIQTAEVDGTSGWRVRYAIADVGAFVEPDSELEAESIRRGQTIYLPDEPVRLHPAELSEGVASLLPDQDRPAVVWDVLLRGDGEVDSFTVYRAIVRSRAKLNYAGVEADRLAESLHPAITELPAVGQARQASDMRRKAINLRMPSVSVEQMDATPTDATPTGEQPNEKAEGEYQLVIEPRQLMNDYNAELSLLAGMCAGQLMMDAGVGLLRTLPPAGPKDEARFWTAATALGFVAGQRTPQIHGATKAQGAVEAQSPAAEQPADSVQETAPRPGAESPRGESERPSIGELLATVDVSTPEGLAIMRDAQTLLRGAGYVAFGFDRAAVREPAGQRDPQPQTAIHAGIGGYYAHVTAPLRRLSDRFATEICLAIASGQEMPEWVTSKIDAVVESMKRTTQLANQVDRACLRLTEAVVLRPWVGQNFNATVLHSEGDKASIFVAEPPVIAPCHGGPEEATQTVVTLVSADAQARAVEFAWPAD